MQCYPHRMHNQLNILPVAPESSRLKETKENEPRREKTCLRGLRPGLTQTRGIILSKQRITKVLIRLIRAFVVRIRYKQVFSIHGSNIMTQSLRTG